MSTSSARRPPCRPSTGDPFDRVLVALALARALRVVTPDQNIAQYSDVTTVW